jgi:membrane-bound lytic murein transglycosylase F
VEDAWRLTLKYGKNTQTWNEVAFYLSLKSDPEYYRDPVVKSGFAKGHIAVNYVRDVLGLFKSYKTLVNP